VLATDICTEVLQTALAGNFYPEEAIAPVPPPLRQRHLLRRQGSIEQSDPDRARLRALVRFGRLNLMAAPYRIDRNVDVIFCRNILIYFDKATQEAVLRQLCAHYASRRLSLPRPLRDARRLLFAAGASPATTLFRRV